MTDIYEKCARCRVILQEKGLYTISGPKGPQNATVSGKYQYEATSPADFPAVGDYVLADPNNGDTAVIHQLCPRKSVFIRKAAGSANVEQVVAANIDTVFICMSLNNDFNLRRLERYLAVAWDSGATPVIVLTKADLATNIQENLSAVEEIAMGVDVLVTSSMEEDGYKQVFPYIKSGNTVAFVGSSGVGKSTLINRLLGEDRLSTNGLRGDDKGRHTTTHRELLALPNGAFVIDTPGMRELGVLDASEGLESAFADVEKLMTQCRFSDCSHTSELGCAVLAAIECGELALDRWQSYQKLGEEISRNEDMSGYLAAKKEKFKTIAKINKKNK